MDANSLLPVLGILALAVVLVIVLLRVMRTRHVEADRGAAPPTVAAPDAAPTKEEQEYLDSSHISGPIVPGGRDALETWRGNRRK